MSGSLILASGSPRRREFMQALGIPFTIQVADVDERDGDGELPADLVSRLSVEKALAVAREQHGRAVVGADTIVTLDGHLLGKPVSPEDAVRMLRRLRDQPHQVYSGITVCGPDGDRPRTAVVRSTVWMRSYSDAEIDAYVASGDPMDKAGAYAIQNAAFRPVSRLQGCYASVMGLPVRALVDLLAEIGVVPPVDSASACTALTGVSCCGGADATYDWET